MAESNELSIDPNTNIGLADEYNEKPVGSGFWRQDIMLLSLAAIAALSGIGFLVFLGLGLFDILFGLPDFGIPILSSVFDWLTTDSRGLFITAGFALVALFALVLLRMRALSNLSLYVGSGCPQCAEHEFIRVRRQQSDRMVARLGIPVRRYVCRNCSWDGLRIGKPLPGSEPEIMPAEILLAAGEGGSQLAEISAKETR